MQENDDMPKKGDIGRKGFGQEEHFNYLVAIDEVENSLSDSKWLAKRKQKFARRLKNIRLGLNDAPLKEIGKVGTASSPDLRPVLRTLVSKVLDILESNELVKPEDIERFMEQEGMKIAARYIDVEGLPGPPFPMEAMIAFQKYQTAYEVRKLIRILGGTSKSATAVRSSDSLTPTIHVFRSGLRVCNLQKALIYQRLMSTISQQ